MNRQLTQINIRTLFWNRKEKRLRSFWRLISMAALTGCLFLALLILMGILLSVSNFSIELDNLSPEQIPFELQLIGILVTAVSIFGSVLLSVKIIDRRRFVDLGFHLDQNWWVDFGFGLLLGASLMTAIFLIELAAGWITISGTIVQRNPEAPFGVSLLQSLILFLCVGIYEETFARGYLLINLAEGLRLPPLSAKLALIFSWFLSSLAFGVFHAGNPHADLVSTLNLVLAGLFLGLGYVLTGELAIPIGLHITWNFFQGNIYGFPVSGTTPAATVIAIQQGGRDFLTGGKFGPEAGLVGVAAILLGSLLIYAWVRWRTGKASLQEHLAIYPEAASF